MGHKKDFKAKKKLRRTPPVKENDRKREKTCLGSFDSARMEECRRRAREKERWRAEKPQGERYKPLVIGGRKDDVIPGPRAP